MNDKLNDWLGIRKNPEKACTITTSTIVNQTLNPKSTWSMSVLDETMSQLNKFICINVILNLFCGVLGYDTMQSGM
jgi:hypothetical protein